MHVLHDVFVYGEEPHQDHLRLGRRLAHRLRQLQGVPVSQCLIHQNYVWLGCRHSSQRLLTICQSRDHREIVLGVEHPSKAVAEQAVIIDDKEAELHNRLARHV